MKNRSKLPTIVLFLALLIIVNPQLGMAGPPVLPSSFFGKVMINGMNVQVGTHVSAWINGTEYANSLVFEFQGSTVYSLDVPGDDPSTTQKEGGSPGDTIEFRVGDQPMLQTASWNSGTSVELNLILWQSVLPIALRNSGQ